MPYGVEPSKVESVFLDGNVEVAAYPEVMKKFDLKPGQTVDEEMARKIVAENEKFYHTA